MPEAIEQKLCPLKESRIFCSGERCGWWTDNKECAMIKIASELSNINWGLQTLSGRN